MKQLFVILILISGLYACTSTKNTGNMNSTKKGKLITAEDSMFYAFSHSLIQQLPIEGLEWNAKSFEKGVNEKIKEKGDWTPESAFAVVQAFGKEIQNSMRQGLSASDLGHLDMDSISYGFGYYLVDQLDKIEVPVAKAAMITGFKDAAEGENMLGDELVTRLSARFNQMANEKAREVETRENAEKAKENIAAAEAFLTENAKKPGIVTLEGGMQYKVLESGDGTGVSATVNNEVIIHYEGRLLDGTVFDSSYQRGERATFLLSRLIQGWQKAIPLMKPGDKWTLWIPSELAYGNAGSPPSIPPGALIVFDIAYFGIAE